MVKYGKETGRRQTPLAHIALDSDFMYDALHCNAEFF
jgi:hypothetical protein